AGFRHCEEEARPPEEVGELDGVALVDAVFEGAAGLLEAGVAERPEKPVAEEVGLALLVAGEVLADVADELVQAGGGVHRRRRLPGRRRRAPPAAAAPPACSPRT